MTTASTPRTSVSVAMLLIVTGVGIALFWLAFFTVGLAPAAPPPCYHAFEHAFPLPDLTLAATLVCAGLGLRAHDPERQRRGERLALLAAGALVFLGLLDVSFNLEQGLYRGAVADIGLSIAINAWCVGFGSYLALRGVRHS